MNYYAILEISPNADRPTIRSAYRELARRYHPDAGPGSSPEKFRKVQEAYDFLRNPERRQAYDASLRAAARRRGKVGAEPWVRRDRRQPFQPEPLRPEGLHPEPLRPEWSVTGDWIDQLFKDLIRTSKDDPFFSL